jgi:hypothetical protein
MRIVAATEGNICFQQYKNNYTEVKEEWENQSNDLIAT